MHLRTLARAPRLIGLLSNIVLITWPPPSNSIVLQVRASNTNSPSGSWWHYSTQYSWAASKVFCVSVCCPVCQENNHIHFIEKMQVLINVCKTLWHPLMKNGISEQHIIRGKFVPMILWEKKVHRSNNLHVYHCCSFVDQILDKYISSSYLSG